MEEADPIPWLADIANYLVGKVPPKGMDYQKKKKLFSELKHYIWEDPYLFRTCADQVIQRYVSHREGWEILSHCHSGPTGGHHSANRTVEKVLELGFYCLTLFKDAQEYVARCDNC